MSDWLLLQPRTFRWGGRGNTKPLRLRGWRRWGQAASGPAGFPPSLGGGLRKQPDKHLPRAGGTRKVRAWQGASLARGDSRGSAAPSHPRTCPLPPKGWLCQHPTSLQSRRQGGLSPPHPALAFQGLWQHPHALLQEVAHCWLVAKRPQSAGERGSGTEQDTVIN